MKRKFLVIVTLALVLSMSVLAVACQNDGELILSIDGNVTSLAAGQKVNLSVKLNGKDCAEAEYKITAGSDYAVVIDGELEINPTAPAGELVSVQATYRTLTSNVVSVSIKSAKLPVITLSASATALNEGQSATLTVKADGQTVTNADIRIVVGADIAAVSNGVLTINDKIQNNSVVVLKAVVGEAESELLSITVTKAAAKTVLLTADSTSLRPGQSADLTVTVDGQPSTDAVVEFVSGNAFATLNNNTLTINDGVANGSQVVLRAKYGEYYSQNLTIVVEVVPYVLSLGKDSFTADKSGLTQTVITPQLTQNAVAVDKSKYTVDATSSNSSVLSVAYDPETGVITLTPNMHGDVVVTVKVTINGGEVKTQSCAVHSIVAPTSITMPQFIKDGVNFAYSKNEVMTFAPEINGVGVCQDFDVTFKLNDQATTEALFENGQITFNSVGNYTIIVTSKSGSANETTVQRSIIVNDGVNVRTYEEFREVMNNRDKQKPVGEVVRVNLLNDLVMDANRYQSTYDIYNSAIVAYGSFDIHGNGYKVDSSNIRIVSLEEIEAGKFNKLSTLIDFKPYLEFNVDGSSKQAYESEISICDLSVYGNLNVFTTLEKYVGANDKEQAELLAQKYLAAKTDPRDGAYRFGIHISGENIYNKITDDKGETVDVINQSASAPVKSVAISNCLFDGFAVASLDIENTVKATINDCYFNNAFNYSCNFKKAQIELNDCTFNNSGVYGIGVSYDKKFAMGSVTGKDGQKYDTIMDELTDIGVTLNNCVSTIVVDGKSVGMRATGLSDTYMGIMGYFTTGDYTALQPYMITKLGEGNAQSNAMEFFMYVSCNDASKLPTLIQINNGQTKGDYALLTELLKGGEAAAAAAQKSQLVLPGSVVGSQYADLYLFFGNCSLNK